MKRCSLSNSRQGEGELLGGAWQSRRIKRIAGPFDQVAIGKEVQPEQRSEFGQRPFGARQIVQPFQKQQRDQGCANLDAQCVFAVIDQIVLLQARDFSPLSDGPAKPAATAAGTTPKRWKLSAETPTE